MTPEFCSLTTYCRGHIVWFGELKYRAKDFVTNENPDESDKFEVYFRTHNVELKRCGTQVIKTKFLGSRFE